MTDPIIARFAEACGATAPLHLRVDLSDGSRRAEGTVAMPFTLVGRDDACDVTLTDPEVNPRHAWLQVVRGRVLAVDLGSRTGLAWPGQGTGSGWLDVGVPMRIGPFQIRICNPVSTQPSSFALRYSPLQSDPGVLETGSFSLEFRNGKRARDRWTVNRLITLVGRAAECKIRLSADDIAAYHCGLVLTPTGLWVVDLSGRGVVVNGERMRVSPLHPGAALWIGRFLIGIHGKSSEHTRSSEPARFDRPLDRFAGPSSEEGGYASPSEDEVPLGIAPPRDPHTDLPSSHIMADAFPMWGSGPGGVSNPILVSGSGPPPTLPPATRTLWHSQSQDLRSDDVSTSKRSGDSRPEQAEPPVLDITAATVVALLRQLGELHGQMLAQFEQSMGLMVRLFACLKPDQVSPIQRELARIKELNAELGRLQAELAHRAVDQSQPHLPAPATPPTVSGSDTLESTALHAWVADRINSLQQERQARWQSLVGMFIPTGSR